MELQFKFTEQSPEEEDIIIENLLGEGKFQVYTVYSPKEKTTYALKVFPDDMSGYSSYQKEQVLSHLQHPNIIKNFPITGHNGDFYCTLTEFAPFGDFFKLTMKNVFQSEIIIRTYFHQLIKGIEYLHSKGIAHLDLKLDNLVLGVDFKLKIIDFDQAQSIEDKKLNCNGTRNYRAPEVVTGKCKNLTAADVYSAGIILFALVAQEFPFYETKDSKGTCLEHYSIFVEDKINFWTMKSSRLEDKRVFSKDLMDLLNEMLEYDATKRMKLQNIKDSKWYQGPVIPQEKLSTKMKVMIDSLSTSESKSQTA